MDYKDVLTGVLSLLMLVGGFLLNRVFFELDRLRMADTELAKSFSDLRPNLIDRPAFDKHVDREERLISGVHDEIKSLQKLVQQLLVEVAALRGNHNGG